MSLIFADSKLETHWKSVPVNDLPPPPDPANDMTVVQSVIHQAAGKVSEVTQPAIAKLTALHESGATESLVYALIAFSLTALAVRAIQKRWLQADTPDAS